VTLPGRTLENSPGRNAATRLGQTISGIKTKDLLQANGGPKSKNGLEKPEKKRERRPRGEPSWGLLLAGGLGQSRDG